MLALKGTIRGNTIVVNDEDLSEYDGKDAIVTILDFPYEGKQRAGFDFDRYVKPTERGKNADEYLKGLRENDRI